jgi:transcriptional regulator with XRE-family HTH domain
MPVMKNRKTRQELRERVYQSFAEEGLSIADTIKSLRAILSLSQQEFSKKMGISLSALRRIEQGHQDYRIMTLVNLLEQFSLDLRVKLKVKDSKERLTTKPD